MALPIFLHVNFFDSDAALALTAFFWGPLWNLSTVDGNKRNACHRRWELFPRDGGA